MASYIRPLAWAGGQTEGRWWAGRLLDDCVVDDDTGISAAMHYLPLSHFRSGGQDRPWLLPSSELSSVPGSTLSSQSAVYQDAGEGLCSGTGRMKLS